MNYPKYCKPLSAAAKEQGRYAMHEARLEEVADGKGLLVCTNGHIVAALEVECEPDDTAGPIPRTALELAQKNPCEWNGLVQMPVNGDCIAVRAPGSPRFPRESDGEFPRWKAVVPLKDETLVRISLNPRLLLDLAKAIGGMNDEMQRVTLQIPSERGQPIRVEAKHGYGAIMPITIDD
jgi:hypothetical protein